MRRVLVIGGASLLGSHLCERLIEDGHEVIAVDDFTSGSFATVAHLRRETRFAFVEHDVTRTFHAHVDAIFHLAVPSSRRSCEPDPVRATVTSVMGTVNALEVAARHGARVVVATSFERWGHGVRCAESLAADYARTRGVDVRFARIASVYGPRMAADDPHVVARFAVQAVRGEDLVLGSSWDVVERLAWVDDAVETLVRTMDSDEGVLAVAAPFVEASVDDVAVAVLDAIESQPRICAAPESGEVLAAAPSSSSTFETIPASIALGQPAALSLGEGVARTVRWFEERLTRRAAFARRTSGFFPTAPLPHLDAG